MSAVVAPAVPEVNSATPAATPAVADKRGDYTCPQCGHFMRVFGLGRHRVYFERDNARLDDPIMNGVCPKCGRRLPGKQ